MQISNRRALAAVAAILITAAHTPIAMAGAGQGLTGEFLAQRMAASDPGKKVVRVAASKIFNLRSPFPTPLKVKIYGSGAGWPKVVWAPAPPLPGIPIPYPGSIMKVRVQLPGGGWSKQFTINWKSGNIKLPKP